MRMLTRVTFISAVCIACSPAPADLCDIASPSPHAGDVPQMKHHTWETGRRRDMIRDGQRTFAAPTALAIAGEQEMGFGVAAQVLPEPGTMVLVLLGAGVGLWRYRSRRER